MSFERKSDFPASGAPKKYQYSIGYSDIQTPGREKVTFGHLFAVFGAFWDISVPEGEKVKIPHFSHFCEKRPGGYTFRCIRHSTSASGENADAFLQIKKVKIMEMPEIS